jgi:hypothetical protein
MKSVDEILSGGGEAVRPETTTEQPVAQAAESSAAEQPGNEEQANEPERQGEQAEGPKTVPLAALHAEKQKVKRYTEEVADVRQKLASQEAMLQQLLASQQRAQAPQPQEAPDYYVDPQNAVLHTVAPHFQRMQAMVEPLFRQVAEQKHGSDAVTSAIAEWQTTVAQQALAPHEVEMVANAPNKFDAVVQWHKQREILKDPDGYRSKIEAELRAKIEAEMRGQQAAPANRPNPTVMPSNLSTVRNVGSRAGPAWAGPTPLQDIFKR